MDVVTIREVKPEMDISLETIAKEAGRDGMTLMGDDVVGYKFIGYRSGLWNGLLRQYQECRRFCQRIERNWLIQNQIPCVEFDPAIWHQH